ncbi:MAG TPA: GMC family oxidoreductase, partial [Acidimicrobiales bacterium]|nr:GMC family oxidoreductase [Acidimicrobiales bacterium]
GGSLIYANVLIRKDEDWFYRRNADGTTTPWPVSRKELDRHYDAVEAILAPKRYPYATSTPKTQAMWSASAGMPVTWGLPRLAVSFANPGDPPVPGEPIYDATGSTTGNLHHRTRTTCRLCGECDLGCNYGSKNTLDYNYLTLAKDKGAELRDLCEVKAFGPCPGGFWVRFVKHDEDGRGPTGPVELRCKRLVLAAGTFGSTFLLLKNKANFPGFDPPRLGQSFSGNGDFLGFIHHIDHSKPSAPDLLSASHGPVITSTIRVPDSVDDGNGPGFYIQDGGYPGFADWLVEMTDFKGELRRGLRFLRHSVTNWLFRRRNPEFDSQLEALLGDAHRSAGVLPLLGMGLDSADGVMALDTAGRLSLRWDSGHSGALFDGVIRQMRALATAMHGKLTVDPLWHIHKKLVTVHPLGGCSMGTTGADGVVNEHGQVFGLPGLVIADGSVMPGPVGPNPSLTIAALADRFADELV